MQIKKFIVKGKVQGVFFRRAVMQIANEKHIFGYVRNLNNGDVEILAIADEKNMRGFIETIKKDIHKYGSMANVISIQETNADFQIVY